MYEGGSYSHGVKEIKGHQTVAIDFRELRDAQTPDTLERVIPLNIEKGQISWSVNGDANKTLSGRSEQVNLSQGISSAYDCRNCCPDSFYDASTVPGTATTFPGDTTQFLSTQRDINCYGVISAPFSISPFEWISFNTGIATVDQNGLSTSLDVGSAVIQSQWFADTWIYWPVNDWCQHQLQETVADAVNEVAPRIDSITPSRGVINATTEVTIEGSGFNSSSTVNVAGAGVTASIQRRTSTSIVVNMNVSSNATPGNHGVTVRTSGQTSNSKNFFVQVPSKLLPFNHNLAPNGIGPLKTPVNEPVKALDGMTPITNFNVCGVYRHYLFFLADQDGQRIYTTFTLDEVFSNYSSPTGLPAPTYVPSTFGPNHNIGDLHLLVYPYPYCLLNNEYQTFTQKFKITIGVAPNAREYFPSTTINIKRGNEGGTLKVDRTITTP
jgi:hypothetical protein